MCSKSPNKFGKPIASLCPNVIHDKHKIEHKHGVAIPPTIIDYSPSCNIVFKSCRVDQEWVLMNIHLIVNIFFQKLASV